jgi:biotin operon repressor
MTSDDAAASACTRNGSGRAWTSLRSAAFRAGVTDEAGPATRNRVRASPAVNPDRSVRGLIAILLLQHREQVTAAEVARELEISERTARRDLDALGMAGVPVRSARTPTTLPQEPVRR